MIEQNYISVIYFASKSTVFVVLGYRECLSLVVPVSSNYTTVI